MKELTIEEGSLITMIKKLIIGFIRRVVEEVIEEKIKNAQLLLTEEVASMKLEKLTVNEAAVIAKVKESTVRSWCRENRIKYSKAGRTYRILRSDLEKYLETKNSWIDA
ncbi:MAG: helix-turn-helix domain-containing protein [Reichenbachiella sp.]